jgi:hypothetical protein
MPTESHVLEESFLTRNTKTCSVALSLFSHVLSTAAVPLTDSTTMLSPAGLQPECSTHSQRQIHKEAVKGSTYEAAVGAGAHAHTGLYAPQDGQTAFWPDGRTVTGRDCNWSAVHKQHWVQLHENNKEHRQPVKELMSQAITLLAGSR